jgi:hypothetical protein
MSQIHNLLGLISAWKAKDIDGVLSFMHDDPWLSEPVFDACQRERLSQRLDRAPAGA